MFTLRIAQEARKVTALDISERMLEILQADAEKAGVSNITIVNSDWLDYEPEEGFTLAFCSMTPALGTEAGRLKLLSLKGAQAVAITARERFRSQIMGAVFAHFGGQESPPPSAGPSLREWLEARGLSPLALPLTGQWRVRRSLDEITQSARCALYNFGIEPEESGLRGFLAPMRGADGAFEEITNYRLEMLVWRNP
jgi:hypothetical protein